MDTEKKMDLDEPVNADMEPDDALRALLGEERRETENDDADSTALTDPPERFRQSE